MPKQKKINVAFAPRPKDPQKMAKTYKNKELTDSEFFSILAADPVESDLTYTEAQKLYKRKAAADKTADKATKGKVTGAIKPHKNSTSFIGGLLEPAQRLDKNVVHRQVINIDIDKTPDNMTAAKLLKFLKHKIKKAGYKAAILLTFGHADNCPRFRVVMILSAPVAINQTFITLTELIGEKLGLSDIMDSVSSTPAQLMFYGRMPKDWQSHIKTPYATIIEGDRIDITDYTAAIATRNTGKQKAAAANHSHDEDGFKGAFNKHIAGQFGGIAAYIDATPEFPFQTNGERLVFDDYTGEDGDGGLIRENEDRIQIFWTGADIVENTGRKQHDAASLCCYYLFGNDFKKFIRYCRKDLKIQVDNYSVEDFGELLENSPQNQRTATGTAKTAKRATKLQKLTQEQRERDSDPTWTSNDPWFIKDDENWVMSQPKKGDPKTLTHVQNLSMVLNHYEPVAGLFIYDWATDKIYLTRRKGIPWEHRSRDLSMQTADIAGLYNLLATEFQQKISFSELKNWLYAHCVTYSNEHSGQSWFESLPKPSKKLEKPFDYIGEIFSYYKIPESPLNRKVLRANLIIAAARFGDVARDDSELRDILEGHQLMAVIEGENGVGKGHMFKSIAPRIHGLSTYLSVVDPKFTDDKDLQIRLASAMIIEFDEMRAFKGNVGTSWKAFRSLTHFILRAAYAPGDKVYPIRGTYWGSTNDPLKADLSNDRTILVLKAGVTTATADYTKDWVKFGKKMWAQIKQEILHMQETRDFSSLTLTPAETAEMVRLNFEQAYQPLVVQEYGDYLDMPLKDNNGEPLDRIQAKTLDEIQGDELLAQYEEFKRADSPQRVPREFCSPKELAIMSLGITALTADDTPRIMNKIKDMQLVLKFKGYIPDPQKSKYFVCGERVNKWIKKVNKT